MTTLYEKRGRRYVPVHDTASFEGLGNGTWVVEVSGGQRTCFRQADPGPTLGALAALPTLAELIASEILDATRSEPNPRPMTPKERKAWAAYCEVMGDDATLSLSRPSAYDAACAVVRKLVERVQGEGS